VRCAVSQSGRATCENLRLGSPTAITSATPVTASFASQRSKSMRGRHDNHRRFEVPAANGSRPIAGGRLCGGKVSELFRTGEWICRRSNRSREALDRILLFGGLLSQRDPIELSCEGVMRQPEVCKHQVCDHCGGRFGMVTHRWWGNKFCKRACKNAHRRENHHTQSGWVIPRFFTFAGGACLAAAVAVAMLTLLLASANAAPGEERPVAGSSLEFNKEDGTLYIDWSGPIVAGMADDLRAALGKYDLEPRGPLPRLGWWSGRRGRPCHRGPQRDQATASTHHRGGPRQAVCVHVHTDLPPRRGLSRGRYGGGDTSFANGFWSSLRRM